MSAQSDTPQTKPSGSPLPKWLFVHLINPLIKAILRSPFHRPVSEHVLLLTFTGHRSGRQYTTPVGYNCDGNHIYLFTKSPWRKNFREKAPVNMLIKGETVSGTARAITDPQAVARIMLAEIDKRGSGYARRRFRLQLETDRPPQFADVLEAAKNTILIEIEMQ